MIKYDKNGVPDFQSLMLPVLKSCAEAEVKTSEVIEALSQELGLSDEAYALRQASGTQTVFYNRVNWAKTHLSKAGLIENTRRGHFSITDAGLEVLRSDPQRVDMKLLGQFEPFREFRQKSNEQVEIEAQDAAEERTPIEVIRAAQAEIDSAVSEELLLRVRQASPAFFEGLIIKLLLSMGYGGAVEEAGKVLGRSGDDGVDGVIDQDALGLDRIYVQAKRYADANVVGPAAIRDFFGSLDRHKATKGLFVTTSSFSRNARETADYLSKRIALVDGAALARLMLRYNVGCQPLEVVELKQVDEDFFL